MNVTMADVAREARSSIASVGRVVHNKGYVSLDARKRIEGAIEKLGYVPNQSARILKGERSGIIGSLVMESMNGLYYSINDAIQRSAKQLGYTCITMEAQQQGAGEMELLRSMVGLHVDGIVIISDSRITREMFELLERSETPVVAVERGYLEQGVDSLLVEDRKAVRDAVGRIANKGHRRIAFIAKEPVHDVERQRLEGYRLALEDRCLPVDEALIRMVPEYDPENGRIAMDQLLALPAPPTAVMTAADTLAAGAMQAAYARGLCIPEDLSIVGYDDVLARYLSPRIDSVGLVLDGVGEAAMELLEERRQDRGRPAECRAIATDYADRGTVRPLIDT